LPPQQRPSPPSRWVGSRIRSFEACSAFTHVTACQLAESPSDPFPSKAPTISLPPSSLRLLPAGTTVAGRESHPLKTHAVHGAREEGVYSFLCFCTNAGWRTVLDVLRGSESRCVLHSCGLARPEARKDCTRSVDLTWSRRACAAVRRRACDRADPGSGRSRVCVLFRVSGEGNPKHTPRSYSPATLAQKRTSVAGVLLGS